MQITIIGAQGQLGQDLMSSLAADGHQLTGLTHQQVSIEDATSIAAALDQSSPELVINTAAYNKVDQAESEPEIAFVINALGPRLLAQYCHQHNRRLLHVSTDYVFGLEGLREPAYKETDAPGPISVYGQSKLAGEYFVRSICPQHYVVRTCGLYGKAGKTRNGNFVETMLRLGKERDELSLINDQHCTPTSTRDLSTAISRLITTDQFGLYHATSSGQTTWCEFAQTIFELTGINVQTKPIPTEEYQAAAERPRYSLLDCSKLEKVTGYAFPHWKQALSTYLESTE
ncbi:dTDP-4-dehydrorhamnose reductase [uncultured Gimesia sp.]|uniref:dTDP-4-dehydrorhamnose reductase n=1 Tax=uncultured Gimesia sp. TaxID=1678688 RepID=UPI0030DD100D|tara:strand:- start:17152 stop:18012 length:861 start_codon:yes stop_codon:yes gene_type:complete